tara:strand:- start:302 stop:1165 length:864 start_codon:yes stop_codon:yes gene_type:complete
MLHERSFLLFEYSGSDDQVTRAHLPFLQNINISEDGKANLASYNLLGRAGQLFSYNGADSRRLKLDFDMSLLHLFHLQETEGFTERMKRTIRNKDKITERNRFLGKAGPPTTYGYAQGEKVKFLNSLGLSLPRAIEIEADGKGTRDAVNFYSITNTDSDATIDLMMYWVNLIRSSVLNDSRNTVYGPPIVRLNHGPMYMNSPCLVEDYKISIDKASNYDLETLLPHTIKVSMSLIESRSGNFGEYFRGDPLEGDNLTGWESILDENVLDSMNYDIEVFDDETFEGLR